MRFVWLFSDLPVVSLLIRLFVVFLVLTEVNNV